MKKKTTRKRSGLTARVESILDNPKPGQVSGVTIRQYSISNIDECSATSRFLLELFRQGWEIASSCMTGPNLVAYTLVKRG